MVPSPYRYAFLGGLREDYFITHDNRVYLGVLGGNAVYAASGARLWTDSIGIVSRVGCNFPAKWLDQLTSAGFNTDGIHVLPDPQDTRTFYAYLSPEERVDTNPAAHFLRIKHPLPKELVDYRSSTEDQDNRATFGSLALRPTDLPKAISDVSAAHIAPADYLTHTTLPLRLREHGVKLVTLDPSERYMDPTFRDELQVVISGLDAFLPSEAEARSYYHPTKMHVWEMAEAFSSMGCHYVIIKCGAGGQRVWDGIAKRRWHVPSYPAQVKDVTGAGDAFCGGFLIGLDQTGDVVEAALRGSISASITVEGSGALYALDTLPELVEARLEALRPLAKQV
jgi:sugar/nucleoside kinase (ribokinase family)